jgi:hypothetical protein
MEHDVDWVALIGAWVLAYGLLLVLPPFFAIPLMLVAVFAWHSRWRQRHGLAPMLQFRNEAS